MSMKDRTQDDVSSCTSTVGLNRLFIDCMILPSECLWVFTQPRTNCFGQCRICALAAAKIVQFSRALHLLMGRKRPCLHLSHTSSVAFYSDWDKYCTSMLVKYLHILHWFGPLKSWISGWSRYIGYRKWTCCQKLANCLYSHHHAMHVFLLTSVFVFSWFPSVRRVAEAFLNSSRPCPRLNDRAPQAPSWIVTPFRPLLGILCPRRAVSDIAHKGFVIFPSIFKWNHWVPSTSLESCSLETSKRGKRRPPPPLDSRYI